MESKGFLTAHKAVGQWYLPSVNCFNCSKQKTKIIDDSFFNQGFYLINSLITFPSCLF